MEGYRGRRSLLQLANLETKSFDRDELIQLLAKLTGFTPEQLDPAVDIYSGLGISSMLALRIVADVEAHYGLTIDETEAADIRTVGQFLDMVESAIALEY